MGEQLRQTGVCKWFNATKGFGFITPEGGGEDLFVHQTNINSEGFRSLREGEAVEFEVEAGPDGRAKAVNVTGPQGHAPEGAPRTYGRGRGGRGGRGARGTAGRGMMPQAFNGYGAYPQMQMAPMPYGYYFFPTTGGRGGRGGRGMMGYPAMPGAAPAAPVDPSGLQVVVHNLPWTCTWQQLKDHFKEWRVERADVVYDAWGRSRGFGTVRFFSKQDAEAACEKLNNTNIEGRTISVRLDRFA